MKQTIKQILREGIINEDRVKMNIPIPSDIQQIKDIFVKNGHKLYVVGGAVIPLQIVHVHYQLNMILFEKDLHLLVFFVLGIVQKHIILKEMIIQCIIDHSL